MSLFNFLYDQEAEARQEARKRRADAVEVIWEKRRRTQPDGEASSSPTEFVPNSSGRWYMQPCEEVDATEPLDGCKTLDGIPQSSAAPPESAAEPESQPSSPRPRQEFEVNIIY
jgi:hypothetical protein